MSPYGKFIAMEGIDGSGKRTQVDLLAKLFVARRIAHVLVSFPRYHSFSGRMVARFLNGEFGKLNEVDPYFSAMLFAGNRFEAKAELEAALAEGKVILADRYVGSNLAHQTARVPADRRDEFLVWLRRLEYDVYGLPREDLVIYLRVSAAEAHRLVASKGAREYTKLTRDLQEADLAHLETAARIYDQLAKEPSWVTVECFDAAAGGLRPPEAIHREVAIAVETRLTYQMLTR